MAEAADPDAETTTDREHLEDVGSGCGCAELWEYLSEQRRDSK